MGTSVSRKEDIKEEIRVGVMEPVEIEPNGLHPSVDPFFGKFTGPITTMQAYSMRHLDPSNIKFGKCYLTHNPRLVKDLNRLKKDIFVRSGACYAPMSVTNYIRSRELSLDRSANFRALYTDVHGRSAPSALQPSECVFLYNKFIPNKKIRVDKVRTKTFCCQFASDGRLLTASQDGNIRLYDRGAGDKYALQMSVNVPHVGWSILDLALSPDGRSVAYGTWSDSIYACRLGDAYDPNDVSWTTILASQPNQFRYVTFAVKYSLDGTQLIASSCSGLVYVIDAENRQIIHAVRGHKDDVNTVCCNPASEHVFITGGDDGLCKVWDRRLLPEIGGSAVGVFAGHRDGVVSCDCREDGLYVLTNSKDQTVKIWDIRHFSSEIDQDETQQSVSKQRWDYRNEECPALFTCAGPLRGDGSLMTLRGHRVMHTLIRAKFSPARTGYRYVYTGCSTGSLYVHDLLYGETVTVLKGHSSVVRDFCWHPLENEIVDVSWDGETALWLYDSRCRNSRNASIDERCDPEAERFVRCANII